MQALAPAHFIFVLWLLAAAAPVATVLLNGSLPAPGWAVSDDQVVRAGASGHEVLGISEQSALAMEPVCGVVSVAGWFSDWVESACSVEAACLAPSLLHTELQRHRPRVA